MLLSDFVVFAGCHGAPFAPGCEMMDFEGDSDVDMGDFTAFLGAFDETPADCNSNSTLDMEEILLDPNLDQNQNGALDQCESTGSMPALSAPGVMLGALLLLAGGAILRVRRTRSGGRARD